MLFKEFAQKVISNHRKDINGENVQWNKIHIFNRKKKTQTPLTSSKISMKCSYSNALTTEKKENCMLH